MTEVLNISTLPTPNSKDITDFIKLDNSLNKIELQLKNNPINLYNKDFENGTYRIQKPGYYILQEDIVFNPNPSVWNSSNNSLEGNDWMPTKEQTEGGINADYPIAPYGGYHLGFFSSITIESDDVILDLNHYTISQSIEHYLQQRFYSHIEFASTPFIPPQGPSNFGQIIFCSNVKIKNGSLGLSSHSGIHGNNMTNVLIENLNIYNYEQAGMSLNGSETVYVRNVTVDNSSRNVFVNAKYSHSRFIRPFVQNAIENGNPTIKINDVYLSGSEILDQLQQEMNTVYNDVVNYKRKPTSALYSNNEQIIDGNIYGVVFNVSGVAVNSFVTETNPSKRNNNILVENLSICDLDSNPKEVVALNDFDENNQPTYGKKVQLGPVGDVFRILEVTNSNGNYVPNVLANAHCYVAKYKNVAYATRTTIEQYIYDEWITSASNILDPSKIQYELGVDSMAHIMKGSIGLFLSGAQNSQFYNIIIKSVKNNGDNGNVDKKTEYTTTYEGNVCRGTAIVACKNVYIDGIHIDTIYSKSSQAIGLDFVNRSSDIEIKHFSISNIRSCDFLNLGEFPNLPGYSKIINGEQNVTNLKMEKF